MLSSVQINVPRELATRLNHLEIQIPQIIELGLRELNASAQVGYKGCADILEFLADLPEPEKIIELRPSEYLQRRISQLLEKNRNEGLTTAEEQEWENYQYLEHLVRIAKARASTDIYLHERCDNKPCRTGFGTPDRAGHLGCGTGHHLQGQRGEGGSDVAR